MHYDPILCMIVPDKAKDAGGFAPGSKAKIVTENEGSPYESFTVEYGGSPLKRGFKTREAAERYAKKQGLTVDSKKALDKAIRTMDANKNEGFKIHKAEIRGDKLYITYTDLLYGEKGTMGFTKNEAKGFLKDPWNTWEGNTKSVMMKFIKDSKTVDKAIRVMDDLRSDKEKALEEYKKAKKAYEKAAENAKTLEEFKALGNTKEFKEFMDKKRICMKLGCRI